MNQYKNIYGAIGYTLLENDKNKILVFADKHDELDNCISDTDIAEWIDNKKNSNILLEEPPRNEIMNLEELWGNSYHTQKLKKLYLSKPHIIKGIDIRPYLIPFNWETTNDNNITLYQYLKQLNDFFSLKNKFFIENLNCYLNMKNIKLGKHFLVIKKLFSNLLNKHKSELFNRIIQIKINNYILLENINNILDSVMEWYICACIKIDKPNIIHTGLYHSEKIVELLEKYYGYNKKNIVGINRMDEVYNNIMSGCIKLPEDIDSQFGGFL